MKSIYSYEQFLEMTSTQRQNFLNEIYGDNTPHKILAKVTELSTYSVKIEAMYLIVRDEYAVPFEKTFPDKRFASIKKGGYRVNDYCNKRNIFTGDVVICSISLRDYPDEQGRVFTFQLKDLVKDVSTITKIYDAYDKIIAEKYSELEKRIDEVNTEIAQKKSQLNAEIADKKAQADAEIAVGKSIFDAQIVDKKSELQSLQQEIFNAQRELENFNDELSKIKKFFGIDDEEKVEEKISVEFHEETNFDSYIFYWQQHLALFHDLSYRSEILESVYWGLHTDQLILLTGSPGTGKTSLVRALPECFGWENSAIIPVQANWTDKSDLLGYYNPLEKNYMSTPFLDALLKFCRKAKKSRDIFIICLDEMKLAHVEHYFAEFLSVLQGDRVIRLYSDDLRRDIYRELKYNAMIFSEDDTEINFDEQRFLKMNLDERKYYLQLCRMANMFFKYPAKFKIPKNIKFFGTLNQDATTLDISPKVIDRSFVIRVEKFDGKIEFKGGGFGKLNFRESFSHDEGVEDFEVEEFLRTLNLSYWKDLPLEVEVDELLRTFNFSLNNRIARAITDLLNSFEKWHYNATSYPEGATFSKNFCDIIIASFVLPKIRFDAKTDEKKISALKNLCEDYPYSKEILEKYMTSPDGKEIDYWRA